MKVLEKYLLFCELTFVKRQIFIKLQSAFPSFKQDKEEMVKHIAWFLLVLGK